MLIEFEVENILSIFIQGKKIGSSKLGLQNLGQKMCLPQPFCRQRTCSYHDNLSCIIPAWAKTVACPVTSLTGGTWELVTHKYGTFLIRHIQNRWHLERRRHLLGILQDPSLTKGT